MQPPAAPFVSHQKDATKHDAIRLLEDATPAGHSSPDEGCNNRSEAIPLPPATTISSSHPNQRRAYRTTIKRMQHRARMPFISHNFPCAQNNKRTRRPGTDCGHPTTPPTAAEREPQPHHGAKRGQQLRTTSELTSTLAFPTWAQHGRARYTPRVPRHSKDAPSLHARRRLRRPPARDPTVPRRDQHPRGRAEGNMP